MGYSYFPPLRGKHLCAKYVSVTFCFQEIIDIIENVYFKTKIGNFAERPFYYQHFCWYSFPVFCSKARKQTLYVYPGAHARNRTVGICCCLLSFGELLICPRHLLCSPKQPQCLLWPLFLQLEMLLLVNNCSTVKSTCNLKKAVSDDNNFVMWNWSYPWDCLLILFK